MVDTDTRIFTNEDVTVSDRLNTILSNNTQYFDVIVGFFFLSGFYKIYKSLEGVDRIRIIIGMEIGEKANNILTLYRDIPTINKTRKYIEQKIKDIFRTEKETEEMVEGVKKFIEYIETGKLQICVYPDKNLHSKVYIILKREGSDDFGKVITGSSNLTASGLSNNLEFNVELKDKPDVKFAEEKFKEIWDKSVEVTKDVLSVIKTKTYINDTITPFELYLKALYEYFGDLIHYNIEELKLPPNFKKLQYQMDAVKQAELKLSAYNGVFLSDVVGLGKTYIAAMLARELRDIGEPLIISPPVLIDYWEQTMKDFGVFATVISNSTVSLEKALQMDLNKYGIVFIDEAHKFRNKDTKTYGLLHQICAGKKVVLISATPLNNAPSDIANQIYLFENKYSSNILGIPNLDAFFSMLQKQYNEAKSKGDLKELMNTNKEIASKMREKVLKHFLIRRTRFDIKKYYGDDLKKQGLQFPHIEEPQKLYYYLDGEVNKLFEETIKFIETARNKHSPNRLFFARYQPLEYLKKSEGWEYLIRDTRQLNKTDMENRRRMEPMLVGLLKALLVKRLDSSFVSFKKSLENILQSYTKMLDMLENGTVYISNDSKAFNFLSSNDISDLDKYIRNLAESYNGLKIPAKYFEKRFKENLEKDYQKISVLKNKWDQIADDPKLNILMEALKLDPVLSNKKILIFTEFEDTEEYLINTLKDNIPDVAEKVLAISHSSRKHSMKELRENFDSNSAVKKDDYRILISTEVLSEGLNLDRAKAVVNYDIPWNPTRVIQRFGRINRVSTKGNIYIYNFFPTEQAEDEIHLKEKAVGKMSLFINALGADAKYLTEELSLNPQGIFDMVNSRKTYEQEGEETDEELSYLQFIRNVRNKNPKLYDKIKEVPAKARTARIGIKDSVLTYFKVGNLSKFFVADENNNTIEVSPAEAFKLLKANLATPKKPLPKFFWNLYNKNKEQFDKSIIVNNIIESKKGGSSEVRFLKIVKALSTYNGLPDNYTEYIKTLKQALIAGAVTNQLIKEAFKKQAKYLINNVAEKISAIESVISPHYLNEKMKQFKESKDKQVILSEAFWGGNNGQK